MPFWNYLLSWFRVWNWKEHPSAPLSNLSNLKSEDFISFLKEKGNIFFKAVATTKRWMCIHRLTNLSWVHEVQVQHHRRIRQDDIFFAVQTHPHLDLQLYEISSSRVHLASVGASDVSEVTLKRCRLETRWMLAFTTYLLSLTVIQSRSCAKGS